jgi:hypothetical protein
MSSIPVYTGPWEDHSKNNIVLGYVITLTARDGGYLIAALSTFVGFVGSCAWAIVAFSVHQSRARSLVGEADLAFMQQQAIYRNQGSSFSAALDMFRICWSWKKPRNRPARVRRCSLLFSLPPLLVFAGFSAAGLFVARTAGEVNESNDVKVAHNRCGFLVYNSTAGFGASQIKVSNDTLAGRAYSRSCYGTNASLVECGVYPVQSLPIITSRVPCPFGSDPTGHDLCRFGNNEAILFDTGRLDSNSVFGINALAKNRVLARKMVTCSPIYIKNYYNITQDPNGNKIDTYYLGPLPDVPTEYTWIYHENTAKDFVSYQVESIYAGGGWEPVAALQNATGDVSVFFVASNSITYLEPVDDPVFAAHQVIEYDTGPTQYGPDQLVNAIACVDQYEICDPTQSPLSCTIHGNFHQVVEGTQELGLNFAQLAAAERIVVPFSMITTYATVNALSTAALLAQDPVHEFISTGLPANQWEVEVRGWVSTSLSKLQSYVVEFAANLVDPGPDGFVQIPGDGPTAQALKSMCSQQRIRNTGAYQTFSVLGLAIIIGVGSIIIILSWTLESCVQRYYRHKPTPANEQGEIARIADHTLQLQRMALLGAGYPNGWDEETLLNHFPVTDPQARFKLPYRKNKTDKYYVYLETQ